MLIAEAETTAYSSMTERMQVEAARVANLPGRLDETELIDSLLSFERLMVGQTAQARVLQADDQPGCDEPPPSFYEMQLDRGFEVSTSARGKSKTRRNHGKPVPMQRPTGRKPRNDSTECTDRAQMREVWLFLMDSVLGGSDTSTSRRVVHRRRAREGKREGKCKVVPQTRTTNMPGTDFSRSLRPRLSSGARSSKIAF